ncbi:unnamed protein product [Protopolystoma xenopodis]|uniref:Uncharacterized protein n=1 Tax=Protopolystoma xenopodis TaxID=117903 RepID=A0A3S5B1H7_9PLAT|nr:unnamed protein product [Protopolystoma xenopodis]
MTDQKTQRVRDLIDKRHDKKLLSYGIRRQRKIKPTRATCDGSILKASTGIDDDRTKLLPCLHAICFNCQVPDQCKKCRDHANILFKEFLGQNDAFGLSSVMTESKELAQQVTVSGKQNELGDEIHADSQCENLPEETSECPSQYGPLEENEALLNNATFNGPKALVDDEASEFSFKDLHVKDLQQNPFIYGLRRLAESVSDSIEQVCDYCCYDNRETEAAFR